MFDEILKNYLYFFTIPRDNRPGRFYTSVITKEVYYDISNINRGIAIIFNHESFESEEIRHGTRKDGDDLKSVLVGLQFDVRMYMNLNADRVRDVLRSGKEFTLLVNAT